MNTQPTSKTSGALRLIALLLTVGLFVVGGRPQAGQLFSGYNHWLAHVAAYGLIAAVYCRALPKLAWPLSAAIVAGIGALHEFYEITAHAHGYEYLDALVNGLGAVIGAFLGARGRDKAAR